MSDNDGRWCVALQSRKTLADRPRVEVKIEACSCWVELIDQFHSQLVSISRSLLGPTALLPGVRWSPMKGNFRRDMAKSSTFHDLSNLPHAWCLMSLVIRAPGLKMAYVSLDI
jgi:hypothetical protein